MIGLKNVLPSKQSMKEVSLSRRNIDHVNGHGERVDHNTHTTQSPTNGMNRKHVKPDGKEATQLGNGDGG